MAVDFCDYFWGEKHDGFQVNLAKKTEPNIGQLNSCEIILIAQCEGLILNLEFWIVKYALLLNILHICRL